MPMMSSTDHQSRMLSAAPPWEQGGLVQQQSRREWPFQERQDEWQ